MTENKVKSSIFIMPRSSSSWEGSEALWITAAGWARAAKKLFPNTIVATTDKIAQPNEVLKYPLLKKENGNLKNKYWFVPIILKTLLKDIMQYRFSKSNKNFQSLKFNDNDKPEFVWEQHDIFPGPGRKIADRYKVPLITYVHAPQVWEARKWGVKRPLWGNWIEQHFESKSLKKSDIVACVSMEVKNKLMNMGVLEEKIIISPMAVDSELFDNVIPNQKLRNMYSLNGKTVIGWIGSFRYFHGVDSLIKAFSIIVKQYTDAVLLLIGTGQEMKVIKELVNELNLENKVIFTGRQDFINIPKFISLFDIAIVSARSNQDFHYSPLKLREYMCAGKPSIAPRAGEIPKVFSDKENILLYEAGNYEDIADKLLMLISNEKLRNKIAQKGREHILKTGTWKYELNKVLSKLELN